MSEETLNNALLGIPRGEVPEAEVRRDLQIAGWITCTERGNYVQCTLTPAGCEKLHELRHTQEQSEVQEKRPAPKVIQIAVDSYADGCTVFILRDDGRVFSHAGKGGGWTEVELPE